MKILRSLYFLTLIFICFLYIQKDTFGSQQLNGLVKTYYCNGELESEIEYKNGKRNGWSTIYYNVKKIREEGGGNIGGYLKIKEKTWYENGIKNGLAYLQDNSLELDFEHFTYLNGVKHGWCYLRKRHGEGGYLIEKAMYQHGKKVGKIYQSYILNGRDLGEINLRYLNADGTYLAEDDPDLNYVDTLEFPETYKKQKWTEPFFGYTTDDYYHFDNLMDGVKETVWVSPREDNEDNYFQWKKFNLKKVKYLVIVNGNREYDGRFYKDYSRIKEAVILFDIRKGTEPDSESTVSEKKFVINFHDNYEIKKIPLFEKRWFKITMIIKSLYPGKKYKNLAVSDFYFEY